MLGINCTSDELDRICRWRNNVPSSDKLEDATSTQAITTQLYKDWLDWVEQDALAWLRKIDKCERRFRSAGFDYHRIPFQLRHSSTMLHGSKIDQGVLNRLSQILESNSSCRN
ncbi:hypothetical protein EK21DRAFT_88494 [Setomelanomma holmii]|uniref:Uncharacterized protein n=1 Tax=Setomelanomma holmii TaxID=210430 RepID=A0A9P4HAL8_9PLEO|nr:hypothetical protein EK21DRAFT_88494 [Setomelanomma holmii]